MSRKDVLDTEYENTEVDISENLVNPGDNININQKDPTIRKLSIGCGWDLNLFKGEDMDLDLAVFLLDRNYKTREDADFVFFNNMKALDGAVIHHGDNRTGAGDGDDEKISIDLQELPFDIIRIAIVISIYQGYDKGQSLSRVRNCFVRLVNEETDQELFRFQLSKEFEDHEHDYALIAGYIDREGPKWHFKPVTEFAGGGLAEIAAGYDIIVMQQ